jgi:hypothetical protein
VTNDPFGPLPFSTGRIIHLEPAQGSCAGYCQDNEDEYCTVTENEGPSDCLAEYVDPSYDEDGPPERSHETQRPKDPDPKSTLYPILALSDSRRNRCPTGAGG